MLIDVEIKKQPEKLPLYTTYKYDVMYNKYSNLCHTDYSVNCNLTQNLSLSVVHLALQSRLFMVIPQEVEHAMNDKDS